MCGKNGRSRTATTHFGVATEFFPRASQGSSFLATLGFVLQSRWDWVSQAPEELNFR